MIDEYSRDGIGWARFSDDRKRRYRLGRILHAPLVAYGWKDLPLTAKRVVFLMINPSTADAFKPDPTISKCCKFALRWGAEILDVVNLFAFRTPYPTDLFKQDIGADGADEWNDAQIVEACTQPGVIKVVAAWGNHGAWRERDVAVCAMLKEQCVNLWCLGTTSSVSAAPKHPMARGHHFIPLDFELEAFP